MNWNDASKALPLQRNLEYPSEELSVDVIVYTSCDIFKHFSAYYCHREKEWSSLVPSHLLMPLDKITHWAYVGKPEEVK